MARISKVSQEAKLFDVGIIIFFSINSKILLVYYNFKIPFQDVEINRVAGLLPCQHYHEKETKFEKDFCLLTILLNY